MHVLCSAQARNEPVFASRKCDRPQTHMYKRVHIHGAAYTNIHVGARTHTRITNCVLAKTYPATRQRDRDIHRIPSSAALRAAVLPGERRGQ